MSHGTDGPRGQTAAGGLLIAGKNTPVPLKSIDVRVTIKGFIANVSSSLRYLNTEQDPIEALYEFPLDDRSAVYQFEAKIEDRVIVAECQEKQQARDTYQDAVRSRRTATLLEEDDNCSDIFRCLVGNLPASTEAVITMSYVTELSLLPDGVVQFVLPTQLHPRYNPSLADGGSRGTLKPVTVSYVPSSVGSPYSFTFCADVVTSRRVQEVKCASSKDEVAVEYTEDHKRAKITLVKEFVPDHDLSLQVSYEDRNKPSAIIEKGNADKEGILRQDVIMLNFYPELKDSDYSNKHEFIFVIDRSGSMAGSAIRAAKETLLFFLKSLPPGCYFNIVGFGSQFDSLFTSGSQEYSEETLKLACNYQSTMSADMGGTEILHPLRDIYNRPPMSTHSRQILIMTDGDVTNQAAVIDLVRKNVNNTRVFSFGIGGGASTSLVKGIARAGRGTAEFVTNTDTMPAQVMKILKQAMQASVTDLHVDWQLDGSPKMVQVPREMPPLFAGDRLVVYGFNSGDETVLAGQVHLSGKIGERSVEFVLNVEDAKDSSPHDAALPIHRLAAKAEIKQLQDKEKDDPEKTKAAIILLSTSANVVSCHTSMVGVDKERKELVVGDLIQRRVPLVVDQFNFHTPRYLAAMSLPVCRSRGAPQPDAWYSDDEEELYYGVPDEYASHEPLATSLAQPRVRLCPPPMLPTRSSDRQASVPSRPMEGRPPPSASRCAPPSPPDEENVYDKFFPAPASPATPAAAMSICMPMDLKPRPKCRTSEQSYMAGDDLIYGDTYEDAPAIYDADDERLLWASAPPPPTVRRCPASMANYCQHQIISKCLGATPDKAVEQRTSSNYMSIISLQNFSGEWKLDDELARVFGLTLDQLINVIPIKAMNVWATALAVAFLTFKFSDKRDEWEMMEMKARQWLGRQDLEGHELEELMKAAADVISGSS